MTTVQDCLQEVIAQGPDYVIHSSIRTGAHRTADWDPRVLLADMQVESPQTLRDHAWTEWSVLADGSHSCAIVYGKRGDSPGERGVLGYGVLHAYESWHKQTLVRGERGEREGDSLMSGFRLGSYTSARTSA
jgi:hypothetical protein